MCHNKNNREKFKKSLKYFDFWLVYFNVQTEWYFRIQEVLLLTPVER